MKINSAFRTAGLVLSLGLLVLCPVAIVQWGKYVGSHYPPPVHYGDHAWALSIASDISLAQLVAAPLAVICARGWKWRVAIAILALAALFIGFCASFGAGMTITNATP